MHRIFIKDFKEYFKSENKRNLKIDIGIKEEIIQIINKLLDYVTNDPSTHLKESNSLILHAIKILEQSEANGSLIASELFEKVGQYYENETQEYNKALKYTETALDIKRKLIHKIDPSLAKSFERNAQIQKKLGNDKQSLEYNEKALEMREKLYSGNHPDIAKSLNNLAVSFERLGDNNKAFEYKTKALEMREKLYSGNHPDIARSLNNLAISYSRLGDEDIAFDYFKKALTMRQFLFADGHPDLIESIENLAASSKRLGKS